MVAHRVMANLDGLPVVTGVLAVPAEHHVYASATGDHAVVVLDDSTLRVVANVAGAEFPDGIAYAPEERRVFVSDESGRREVVIDARTMGSWRRSIWTARLGTRSTTRAHIA
jgi:YVTN family beta-propeller protein